MAINTHGKKKGPPTIKSTETVKNFQLNTIRFTKETSNKYAGISEWTDA